MERVSRGFRLLRASWDVLMADKELLLLPIISFVAMLAFAAPMALGVYGAGLPAEGESPSAMQYVFLAMFYFGTSFIAIFFNAAIVGCATIRLQGGDPTPRDGMRMAYQRIDKIIGWALLTTTIGFILRALQERAGFIGRLVISLVGAAWSAITFFVVPVLLFEPESVTGSVKRSATLFKERWGEQFVGNGSIALAMFVLSIPAIFLTVVLVAAAPPIGVLFGVLAVGALVTVGTAVSGIFNAALYRYAVTGAPGGSFTEADLRESFTPRRPRRGGLGGGGLGGGGLGGGGFSG